MIEMRRLKNVIFIEMIFFLIFQQTCQSIFCDYWVKIGFNSFKRRKLSLANKEIVNYTSNMVSIYLFIVSDW